MTWARTISLLIAAGFCLAGCDCDQPAPTGPAPSVAPPRSATALPAASATASATQPKPGDLLSEDHFRQLHVAPAEAPLHRGEGLSVGSSRGYLSLPDGAQPPLPGVVVIHDRWGLDDHFKRWADRLAADGYAAVAVDLYGGAVAHTPAEAEELMGKVDDDEARRLVLEAYALLADDERIQAPKRGALGWCLGGRWAVELALAAPQLDAVVVYYGHGTFAADQLAALEAPLLGLYGRDDELVDEKAVDRFEFGLEQAGGKRYELLRLAGGHGFANPARSTYAAEPAAAAWHKVRAFLREQLATPDGGPPGGLPSRP
ncbi:MAG: dienelactone hydrolase family protein [Deltaproteobacteria bacterium]|nr:dienelactone hydrolase family protein [Deltaproteobacteria bacterium]